MAIMQFLEIIGISTKILEVHLQAVILHYCMDSLTCHWFQTGFKLFIYIFMEYCSKFENSYRLILDTDSVKLDK